MKIINEPKYQSFTGEVYTSQAECEREDKEYRIHIIEELKKLQKYCTDSPCECCPFVLDDECSIGFTIRGNAPADWGDWE